MVDVISTVNAITKETTTASQTLSDNFDTFLNLLTAQLQNQDPLEPVDSSEFTNQLVQFSGVEQQIQTNQNLADLIELTSSSTLAGLSGYLGQSVEIDSLVAELGDEGIEWLYTLPDDTQAVTISVQDENGNTIYTEKVSATPGEGSFQWDGEVTSGSERTDGLYYISIQATDSDGTALDVPVRVHSTVTGIDLSADATAVSTGSGTFYFDQVVRLSAQS
ncbi:flagellar hook capping FlgD N-terminal domain-containing protein [Ponticaulis sp.]|uniref:flagellar hook assembly protein FlgD n=1 Tax=Ponticaulis sp. TaxID=2020902 RepID=UPI000B697694|nr:flagellar hook capping FlgD N-terminal domain-containing protein [Ponticaulis sp.]MAI89789.1 flagellar hook capping protein [Ponticaulis sp.]OUX99467.1 MAG: hypothetical protein CBB65_05060 [Hyphomonadaceae bacterium TMED5]|tara:strand:+ start:23282 stop:23941 length:660 start_codon:yes stop_codon:yes gene_type:complete